LTSFRFYALHFTSLHFTSLLDEGRLLADRLAVCGCGEKGRLGPGKVGNAEHVVDVKQKEDCVRNIDGFEATSIGWRQRSASGPLGSVKDGRWNGVGTEAVAESTREVGEPIQRKEEGVVGVAAVGHGNAHEGDVKAGEGHESDDGARRITGCFDGGVSPQTVVHDKESKVLNDHHGGVEGDGGFVGRDRKDWHVGVYFIGV